MNHNKFRKQLEYNWLQYWCKYFWTGRSFMSHIYGVVNSSWSTEAKNRELDKLKLNIEEKWKQQRRKKMK